ncbi:hypothetical protein [Streptomyces avermitilis]|uniref:hypothetical protein n=1 Tax=Streptomyces avermitilis TaxID=33903 RepID=UPI00368DA378
MLKELLGHGARGPHTGILFAAVAELGAVDDVIGFIVCPATAAACIPPSPKSSR